MRKISFIAAAGLLVLPAVSQAKPLNELLAEKGGVLGAKEATPAKVSYNNGLNFDFGDASMTSNVGLQTVYTYSDVDGGNDSSSFDVQNARLELGGSLMNGEFSWKLSNNFGSYDSESGQSGSTLDDAYINWNACEDWGLRMGQFKTAFNRQTGIGYNNLQFIDYSRVAHAFGLGRQAGLAFMQNLGGAAKHSLGVFNGMSTGEGQNLSGNDTKVMGVYGINASLVGDYDRSYEGDPMNSGDLSVGLGAAGFVGQGNVAIGVDDSTTFGTTFDQYGANVDLGFRSAGLSGQLEFYYAGQKWDDELGGIDKADNYGLYAQAGYFIEPSAWEVAARFGWVSYDTDAAGLLYDGVEDEYEVNLVLAYYINGHNLKFMTGPSWVNSKLADDSADDPTDFRYQAGLFGHF